MQTIGIVGGLLVAGAALRADLRARRHETEVRKVETLMLTTQYHREIWGRMLEDPDLERILDADADVIVMPPSEKERMFCTFLILHFYATYEAAKTGLFSANWTEARDFGELVSLPIPAFTWAQIKSYHNRDFVKYVDDAIATWGTGPRSADGNAIGEPG